MPLSHVPRRRRLLSIRNGQSRRSNGVFPHPARYQVKHPTAHRPADRPVCIEQRRLRYWYRRPRLCTRRTSSWRQTQHISSGYRFAIYGPLANSFHLFTSPPAPPSFTQISIRSSSSVVARFAATGVGGRSETGVVTRACSGPSPLLRDGGWERGDLFILVQCAILRTKAAGRSLVISR